MLFLASQIMFWIGLSFLFGLGIGWWISGAMLLDLGSSKSSTFKSDSAQPGSVSVLSDSLLKTQRELESCQQSLAQAESRLQELDIRYQPGEKKSTDETEASSNIDLQLSSNGAGGRDDLKLIYGIGPFIEQKLAELDITTYVQIVNLTEEDIERIGEHLNYFPDRIARDGWISSARELHRAKYGEEV